MHRVWFLFLVRLEYNITQPCKRRWYHLIFCNKCSFVLKSLDFFENLFQLFMWNNCWKFRSITNFYYYIPLLFVCWPLDYLFKTYCWRKEGAFYGKTTRQGSKKKGRCYHHFCTYLYIWILEQELSFFSQRFLTPLTKSQYEILYIPCKAVH